MVPDALAVQVRENAFVMVPIRSEARKIFLIGDFNRILKGIRKILSL